MLSLALICATAALAPGEWRSYEVYTPRIERHHVVDISTQELKYNHDSSIAWFRDRWFCLWNGNEPRHEGRPGQLNYVSTSPDGRNWSPPEAVFSSEEHSVNPIPCPTGTQWQPNLIVISEELWAVWSQGSRDENVGCYVSKLSDPDGRWVNRRLEWNGSHRPEVDGKMFRLFPTQNPIQLRSGRVLAPVTMIGPPAEDAPPNLTKSWWATEKRDSVLYTDDSGDTWQVSPGAVQPGRTWAQWEPTVWEQSDGAVMMFSRNNDFRGRTEDGPRPSEMLLWSKSADGGETWTPHEYVPLETVASRMHVLPAGGVRFMMVHNDWPAGRFVSDRNNLALFFIRGDGINFVAGPGVTGREPVVAYPQMWVRDDSVLISYSQGSSPRSIKVVHVSPLPDPERYYLFPRDNLLPSVVPRRVGDSYSFGGMQHIATREVVEPGDKAFSAGVWVRPRESGVILDTRDANQPRGFAWGLMNSAKGSLQPFLFLGTPKRNMTPSFELQYGVWTYVGLTVDMQSGTATFYVDGKADRVDFDASKSYALQGTTGRIGAKRFESSQLIGLGGELRVLAIYPSTLFGAEEHDWLYNAFAEELGQPIRSPARAPEVEPVLWLDPADDASFGDNFALPENQSGGIEVVTIDGSQALRFSGEASAGVDLDENDRDRGDRIKIGFRFKIESGDGQVLCTVGDANQPARVVVRSDEVWLQATAGAVRCGKVKRGGWTQIGVITAGDETSVTVGDGQSAGVRHQPIATWVYFGQGYRTGAIPAASRFLVDVDSVRSRVYRVSGIRAQ